MIDPSSQLIRKYVEVAKQLNVYLLHFPKHEKYALVNTIKNDLYQVFRLIIEGQKRYHKKTTLTELDIAHEQLRMQLYLAYELGYFKCKTGNQDSEMTKRAIFEGDLVSDISQGTHPGQTDHELT